MSCDSVMHAAAVVPTLVRPHGYQMATYAHEDVVSSALQQTGRWETDSIATLGVDNATDARAGTFIDIGAKYVTRSMTFACTPSQEPSCSSLTRALT